MFKKELDFFLIGVDVLKNVYLLSTYLNDNEYKEICQTHYKGKISKAFKKIVETHGKDYELPKNVLDEIGIESRMVVIRHCKNGERDLFNV